MAESRNHAPWCSFAHDGPCPAENEAMAMHRGEIPMPAVPSREPPVTPSERERRILPADYEIFWERRYNEQHRTLHSCEDALREARERAERAEATARELRRAIVEHRTTVYNAGLVRVDRRDKPQADAKHRADKRLWECVDTPFFSGKEGTER